MFAVIGGQLVPGFEGALPEAQVREFIGAVLQAAEQAGLSGPAPAGRRGRATGAATRRPPEDPRFDAAEAALADGDYDLARQRFQAILDAEPANAAAAARAAPGRPARARREARGLPPRSATRQPTTSPASSARPTSRSSAATCAGALRRLLDLLARTAGDERETCASG